MIAVLIGVMVGGFLGMLVAGLLVGLSRNAEEERVQAAYQEGVKRGRGSR